MLSRKEADRLLFVEDEAAWAGASRQPEGEGYTGFGIAKLTRKDEAWRKAFLRRGFIQSLATNQIVTVRGNCAKSSQ
ncbi:hypothetical protein N8076_04145 [Gammaproteobacteria bacterium]|nr:hypothetical protein [Gammaproteobacteria bacterium]